jgi:hypothetical protein
MMYFIRGLCVVVAIGAHFISAEEPLRDRVYKGGTVEFGGYTWETKQGARLGPAANRWLGSNVKITDDGGMRLRIDRDEQDRWTCAEARVTQPLGYGEYRWTIAGNLDAMDSHAVLGLFLYQDDRHEIDFELSRWAGRGDTWNGQFAIMPSEDDAEMVRKGRVHRFDASGHTTLTISLLWTGDRVRDRCWSGSDTEAEPLTDWSFTYKDERIKPDPAQAHCIMNLWLTKAKSPGNARTQEVTITKFAFTPEK